MDSSRWKDLGAFLIREEERAIRGPARRRLLELHREIEARERSLDDRLFIGIIGGTGVGKSTLINAIAGTTISSAGDRRPTTDRVVAYRHRRSPLPDDLPIEDLARPEAVHDEAPLERLVIFDFPDFDSVEADHARILAGFLPRLDILLVMVDDEKYADECLHRLLRSVPQARANLHFIFNKLDRLSARYPKRWREVAEEILADLREKLLVHAGLEAPRERVRALSARAALERRLAIRRSPGASQGAAGNGPTPTVEGDFMVLLELLASYRAEKRRRAAKVANLDAAKEALLVEARRAGLDPRLGERGEALRRTIGQRGAEISGLLRALPREVLGSAERRSLQGEALDRAAPSLPFPLGWALARLAPGGPRRQISPEGLAALARERYRPIDEMILAMERELGGAVSDLAGPELPRLEREDRLPEISGEFRARLQARLERTRRFARLRAHCFPVLIVLGAIWMALQPVMAELLGRRAEGKAIEWGGLLWKAGAAFAAALSPSGILVFLGMVLSAYLLALLLDLRKVRRAVEQTVRTFEDQVRLATDQRLRDAINRLQAPLDLWGKDRERLNQLLK